MHIRRNAAKFRVDPFKVAVCGFSAGGASGGIHGHPVGCRASAESLSIHAEEARPDAVVLGYPVITSGIMTHGGSIKNLCGDDAELKATMSLENQIRGDLPPFFIWHTVEDGSVPVQNSLLLASALTEHKVPFELHLFNHDGHGTSTCTRGGQHPQRPQPRLGGSVYGLAGRPLQLSPVRKMTKHEDHVLHIAPL